MTKPKGLSLGEPPPSFRSRKGLFFGIVTVAVLVAGLVLFLTRPRLFARSQVDPNAEHHVGEHSAGAKPQDPESAARVNTNSVSAPGPAPAGMVWIPGGTFWMGC